MSENKRSKAKMMALKDMKSKMKGKVGESIADKMPMKVTVASDTEEGLKEGLSKAEEIMKMKMGKGYYPVEARKRNHPLDDEKEKK